MLRRIVPLALALAAPATFAGSDFLRPGQWEMTMQIVRDGKNVTESTVTRRCVTSETLEQERRLTFQPFDTGCTGKHQQKGKEIAWTYECAGPPPMKGSGKLTYGKDRYWGESESFADLSGGKSLRSVHTEVKFVSKRIGTCTLAPPKGQIKTSRRPR